MKKLIVLLSVIVAINILFADLEINIPFDLDIIGPSYTENGNYEHTTDWITLTNTGTEIQTYTLLYSFQNLPAGWTMSVCNPLYCFIPNFPSPIELASNESIQIHIVINVSSIGGYNFNFTFNGEDLTEPLSYDFTFNTADNVGIEHDDFILNDEILLTNYPNPFKETTTISFQFSNEQNQQNEQIKLEIYNIKGQKIRTFPNLQINKSTNQQIIWDGRDENGSRVLGGTYFYELSNGKTHKINKMILW